MKGYIKQLGLDHDPFEPGRRGSDFFTGGNRQTVLERVLEQVLYSDAMVAIHGPLGSGKTTLGRTLLRQLGDDAICAEVNTTLFMNAPQFFETLIAQLPEVGVINDPATTMDRLAAYISQLDLDARFLLVLIDDAHELNMDVVAELDALQQRCPKGSLHVVMQGEAQLLRLLESVFADQPDRVVSFGLDSFSSEASIEYIKFKLAQAGYLKSVPLSGQTLGALHNSAAGLPGKLNAVVSDALSAATSTAPPADSEERLEPGLGAISPDLGDDWDGWSAQEEPENAQNPIPSPESAPLWQQHRLSIGIVAFALVGIGLLTLGGEDTPAPGEPGWSDVDNQLRIPVRVTAESAGENLLANADGGANDTRTPAQGRQLVASDEQAPAVVAAPSERPSTNADEAAVVPETSAAVSNVANAEKRPESGATAKVEAPVSSASAGLSAFEQRLMTSPDAHFTAQLLGSRSEENVRRFIEQHALARRGGYFETRLNGSPWFVVVAGPFSSRADADALVAGLSAELKSLEPWVRSVGSIQTDLGKLHGM